MSVPDDPFAEPRRGTEVVSSTSPSPPSSLQPGPTGSTTHLPRLTTSETALHNVPASSVFTSAPATTASTSVPMTTSTSGGPLSGSGSGTKTPRRVQWTTDHVVSITPPTPSSALSPSGADSAIKFPPRVYSRAHHERQPMAPVLKTSDVNRTPPNQVSQVAQAAAEGASLPSPTHTLDETNFEQVRSALERHRSRNDGAPRRRAFHKDLGFGDDAERDNSENERRDSVADLAPSRSPAHDDDDDEEDYDYRLDHPHSRPRLFGHSDLSSNRSSIIDMSSYPEDSHDNSAGYTPGETFGDLTAIHPSAVAAGQGHELPLHHHHHHPFPRGQEYIGQENTGQEESTEPDGIHSQMPVFVDPTETDGLPSMPPPEGGYTQDRNGNPLSPTNDTHAQASALIKAHKTGRFGQFVRNRKHGLTKATGQLFGATKADDPKSMNEKSGHPNANDNAEAEKGMDAFASRYPERPSALAGMMGAQYGRRGQASSPAGAAMGMGGALAGGGVLASLLALYDNGQNNRSGTSTPASSRPASLALSVSDEDSSDEERERERERERRREKERRKNKEDERRREKEEKRQRKKELQSNMTIDTRNRGFSQSSTGTRRSQHTPSDLPSPGDGHFVTSPGLTHGHRTASGTSLVEMGRQQTRQMFSSVKKAADRLGLDVAERPKQARSGAGVFGALMQTTGGLTGAAAPHAATIAPSSKRAGYALTRYSLGPGADLPSPTGPGVDRPALSRPTSLYAQSEPDGTGENQSPSSSSGTRVEANLAPLNRSKTDDGVMRPHHIDLPSPRHRDHKHFSLKNIGSAVTTPIAAGTRAWLRSGTRSQAGTPPSEYGSEKGDYFSSEKMGRQMSEDERRRREWEKEKKRRKKAKEKRKQQEIFIIQHVAAILARQQFLMKLARAFMMFGSPSHRLEAQIQSTARVLDVNCQVVHLPGVLLVSFIDESTHTTETKFLKQPTGLDLGKLLQAHLVYWNVTHDLVSAEEASKQLDVLMTSKPYYNNKAMLLIGGMCSSFICCIAFYGSFIDALISFPLGVLLIAVQIMAARNDLYSNVFEITIATISSFLAAALASTKYFCYTAVASSAIVLILPGYIVLSGSLELASRNIVSGSVRIGYAVIYSLFLGFGLSIGAELYHRITGLTVVGANDYTCGSTHYSGAPWWLATPSAWWYFFIAPGYSFWLSLRQSQPLLRKETIVMVLIACAGWTCNHFSGQAFPGRSDISSMIGSFVVGVLGNLWGRFFKGTSFIVMLVGVLFQLPSGLGNGGLLSFSQDATNGNSNAWSTGFSVAQQLVQVSIGLTVGLFVAAVVTNPFGPGRRKGTVFSF